MKKTLAYWIQGAITCALILLGACSKEDGQIILPDPGPGSGSISIKVIEDEVGETPIVVVGSRGRNFMAAFERNFNGQVLSFTAVQNSLPVVMEDDLGNRWDAFGQAIFGPDQGSRLDLLNTGMGFWFVFGAMYPGIEIHGLGRREVSIRQDTMPGWSIPTSAVAQGSGFDAITALEDPEFFTYSVSQVEPDGDFYLDDDDLVIAVALNGETKVYPHAILDWHEVINDVIGGVPVSVTYCPLTGTAKVWERQGATPTFSFGVSGLLYNSNVIPFDRQTESFWNQIEANCVFGDRRGERLQLVPHLETTFGSWLGFDADPLLMTTNTGINRDYRVYPYGNYRTSEIVSYPLSYDDDRLPRKERVFAVLVDGRAKVYRLSDF